MSAAPQALPRDEWRAALSANIADGDALIRAVAAELPRARARGEHKNGDSLHQDDDSLHQDDPPAPRFAKDQLKALVERIERLAEEKKAISDDIADVYAEAKANGFDKKALHVVVRMRGQDINERKEHEAIVETYLHAMGMLE